MVIFLGGWYFLVAIFLGRVVTGGIRPQKSYIPMKSFTERQPISVYLLKISLHKQTRHPITFTLVYNQTHNFVQFKLNHLKLTINSLKIL